MFDEMEKIIDFLNEVKKQEDGSAREEMIRWASVRQIMNKYILLIPNKKNLEDAELIRNIDPTKIYLECDKSSREFSIFGILKEYDTTKEIIEYFKNNSIILLRDDNVEKQFNEVVKVYDRMIDNYHRRHLTRRNLDFANSLLMNRIKTALTVYLMKKTLDSNIQIKDITFVDRTVFSVEIVGDVHIPDGDFHNQSLIDKDVFIKEQLDEIENTINNSPLFRNLTHVLKKCSISVAGIDRGERLFGRKIVKEEKFVIASTNKVSNDSMLAKVDISMPYEIFIKRVLKYL